MINLLDSLAQWEIVLSVIIMEHILHLALLLEN